MSRARSLSSLSAPLNREKSVYVLFKNPPPLVRRQTTAILIRARSVVQVHPGPTFKSGSDPETWVTECTGYIGDTFGPNGFSIGSKMVSFMDYDLGYFCSRVLDLASADARKPRYLVYSQP
jgi:hypothetical protein